MKKTLILTGILALSLGAFGVASAHDCGKDKAEKTASTCSKSATAQAASAKAPGDACCPVTAAKTAHAEALQESGCEKTAKAAYAQAMGEAAYSNACAESSCEASAAKATYAYVKEQTGCAKTAAMAYTHAVAKAAHDASLAEHGCEKSARTAYEKAEKKAEKQLAELAKSDAADAS